MALIAATLALSAAPARAAPFSSRLQPLQCGLALDGADAAAQRLSPGVPAAAARKRDLVAYRHPNAELTFIKRVIGLPGERVQMIGGCLYLNGEAGAREYLEGIAVPVCPSKARNAARRCQLSDPRHRRGRSFGQHGGYHGAGRPLLRDSGQPRQFPGQPVARSRHGARLQHPRSSRVGLSLGEGRRHLLAVLDLAAAGALGAHPDADAMTLAPRRPWGLSVAS